MERGEHSEGERRGGSAIASARLLRASDRAQRPACAKGPQHQADMHGGGGNKSRCYFSLQMLQVWQTLKRGGGSRGGVPMSLDKTHTRRVCPVRNARRYETAEPHQDSQGRARTSAARDEGMPQGAPVAPRGHRGRCKTDAESARVTARAKGACKADATRAGAARVSGNGATPIGYRATPMPPPREREWCNADAT